MDRFIGLSVYAVIATVVDLKSNMDRFIVRKIQNDFITAKSFKIQYG